MYNKTVVDWDKDNICDSLDLAYNRNVNISLLPANPNLYGALIPRIQEF